MINIGDNILKELDFNKNSDTNSSKNTKGNLKSNSFNRILDKNIQNEKNNKVKKCLKKENNEIDDKLKENQKYKVSKKKVEDALESILLMLNLNDTSKELNTEDIIEINENMDINSLKEMVFEVLEKYISIEAVQKEDIGNFQEKDMIFKTKDNSMDTIQGQQFLGEYSLLQEKSRETLKDIVSQVLDKYIGGFENNKENSTKSDKTLEMLKKVIAESVEKDLHNGDYGEGKNIISKIKDVHDFTIESDFKNKNFLNIFNLKSKENSFLEKLTRDEPKNENFDIDKINFHLNKMNDLNKIGNEIELNNVNKAQFVNKQTFDFDVVKSIKYMNLNNMKELTLKVVPRELGELLIKVSMDNGVLKASITSNTKETYELLQNNMKSILEKLQSESIKIEEFSVDIYDQNNTSSNSQSFKDRREEYDGYFKDKLKEIHSVSEEEDIGTTVDEVLNMLA